MKKNRRKYTPSEHLALTTQVGGTCPLCGIALFYRKKSNAYKRYELAHIYPLNPTKVQQKELENEELLDSDVNHPNNLIPLCTSCHGEFDKPRTKDFVSVLNNLKIDRSCLVTSSEMDVNLYKSARNVNRIAVMPVAELNAGDICNYGKILFTKEAFLSLLNKDKPQL